MSKLIRLQIEISPEQMTKLEKLQEVGGMITKRELLNNAFTLLQWAVRERQRGGCIVSVNEKDGTYKQLEMPFLESAAECDEGSENHYSSTADNNKDLSEGLTGRVGIVKSAARSN